MKHCEVFCVKSVLSFLWVSLGDILLYSAKTFKNVAYMSKYFQGYYTLWRTNTYFKISLFSVSPLWRSIVPLFSGGFTFFELMKRGVPLHLIDKYMNESKTSEESEKKGSIWGLTHPMITQKSRSLLQIMCLNFGMVCCVQTCSRKLCVCHRAIM